MIAFLHSLCLFCDILRLICCKDMFFRYNNNDYIINFNLFAHRKA